MKLGTFFISSTSTRHTRRIFKKLLAISESLIKNLCNIFKTANAIRLTKTIFESLYKDLLS